MNKKSITHGIIVASIILAVFVAAALTPAGAYKNSSDQGSRVVASDMKMIPDNEIPLAATPSDAGSRTSLWAIVVTLSALMTGIVIFEECKDSRSKHV